MGCAGGADHAVTKEEIPRPVDSFSVSGIDIGQQVQNFQYINDSILCSYNLVERELVFFHRVGHVYKPSAHQSIDAPSWSSHFVGDDRQHYFISRENDLIAYNEEGSKKLSGKPIRHVFEHIKDSFMILSSHDAPVIKMHDTLLAFYGFNSLQSYRHYVKEPAMAEFSIGHDSVKLIANYLPKPAGLEHYLLPTARYTFVNNTVFLIYPCYDTIYSYNRTSHIASKACIHNKDYALPASYDNSMAFKPDYGSYFTQYLLNNFQYSVIYYNVITHHFILFYFPPVAQQFKDRMATPDDQKMKAVVLDESLQTIGYLKFDIKGFVSPDSYFFIPGKGLAIPTVKSTDDYETAKFYIYNL